MPKKGGKRVSSLLMLSEMNENLTKPVIIVEKDPDSPEVNSGRREATRLSSREYPQEYRCQNWQG